MSTSSTFLNPPRLLPTGVRLLLGFLAAAWIPASALCAAGPAIIKSQSFDRDPQWEGFNNRMKPQKSTTITQDFGYSPSRFAGGQAGELGGAIQRSMTP